MMKFIFDVPHLGNKLNTLAHQLYSFAAYFSFSLSQSPPPSLSLTIALFRVIFSSLVLRRASPYPSHISVASTFRLCQYL